MYHVPNDKRTKDTAFKIYKSLRHNLREKKLNEITIVDIYNESKIARSTFYRLFDNLEDVLEYQLEFFVNEYNELRKDKEDKVLFFYEYFNKHSDLIYIISTQCEHVLKKVLEKSYNHSDIYYMSVKIGIMTSLLCTWSKNNKKETPEEMAIITRKILSTQIEKILTEL